MSDSIGAEAAGAPLSEPAVLTERERDLLHTARPKLGNKSLVGEGGNRVPGAAVRALRVGPAPPVSAMRVLNMFSKT